MTEICPDASTAPRGCGLVRVQIIHDAQGRPIGKWRCTFCAEQRSIAVTARSAALTTSDQSMTIVAGREVG